MKVDSYPGSEKIYIDGQLFPIKVGMRRINLTPTVTIDSDGNKTFTKNDPVYVYDTSGVYTDPNVKIDINKGISRIRQQINSFDLKHLHGKLLSKPQISRLKSIESASDRVISPLPKHAGMPVRNSKTSMPELLYCPNYCIH